MFRKLLNNAKNIKRVVAEYPDLYERQLLGFTGVGMCGGFYLGFEDTREYCDTSFSSTIFKMSTYGTVGAFSGFVFGTCSPVIMPFALIFGVASLGVYGYNKVNPVIPWHQQEEYKKKYKEEQIIVNEGFIIDIPKNN